MAGRDFLAIDTAWAHPLTFTPAISIFVDCQSERKVEELFAKLSDGGIVLMRLLEYALSARFGWVEDRYSVPWRVNRRTHGSLTGERGGESDHGTAR